MSLRWKIAQAVFATNVVHDAMRREKNSSNPAIPSAIATADSRGAFTAALATVAATDMVTTVSKSFARRFAAAFELVLKSPPFTATDLRLTIVWSHIRDSDPLLARFRERLADVASTPKTP